MEEAKYRGSRLCRLLGNPVIYQLVVLLENDGPLTPSKLAKYAGRSVQTVSGHLGVCPSNLKVGDFGGKKTILDPPIVDPRAFCEVDFLQATLLGRASSQAAGRRPRQI
jgi:hypothetical protein